MCLGIPGEIIEISDTWANVKIMGVETTVNTQLIENPKAGEYVLIHGGCAIEKINKIYFDDLFQLFKKLIDEDGKRDG